MIKKNKHNKNNFTELQKYLSSINANTNKNMREINKSIIEANLVTWKRLIYNININNFTLKEAQNINTEVFQNEIPQHCIISYYQDYKKNLTCAYTMLTELISKGKLAPKDVFRTTLIEACDSIKSFEDKAIKWRDKINISKCVVIEDYDIDYTKNNKNYEKMLQYLSSKALNEKDFRIVFVQKDLLEKEEEKKDGIMNIDRKIGLQAHKEKLYKHYENILKAFNRNIVIYTFHKKSRIYNNSSSV